MGGDMVHPMWWQTLPLVLATIGSASYGALCPARCKCNDETLNASCTSAALEVVPIQLNPEVRHIDLSQNKITNVHFTLSFYNNLITLNLSTNKIKTLGSTNFEFQHHLKFLNLSFNEIEKMYKDSLKGLRAVTILDLSYNRLEELTWGTFRELHSLQTLNLSENRLVYLEQGLFKSSKQLKELLLNHNSFLQVPTAALMDAINLRYLSLSKNLLKSIDEDEMPNLSELRNLLLDKNIINDIHQSALSGLLTLQHLDLSDNNFTVIPTASLAKLSNLTKLLLSGNFVNAVPPVAFRGLFHLCLLKLDRQDLLERIDVRAFVDNINLKEVWLDDNIALERLPTRLFHGNPKITYLSIRNNRLTNLEATHLPLDQLQFLKLGGNPFQCNCTLSWLWHLIHDQKVNLKNSNQTSPSDHLVLDSDEILCAGPENVINVLLIDVTESQIGCSIGWIAIAISATAAIVFIGVIVGGLLLYWGSNRRTSAKGKKITNKNNCHHMKTPSCSNGRHESCESAQIDKCMIGPPLIGHHDYRTLPSWDIYHQNCASTFSIYEQLDANTTRSPHIVYV